LTENLKSLNSLQNWIKSLYNDPIAKILINNSNLTKTQLETLLIDVGSNHLSDKRLKIEEKAKLRLKGEISKGAFNRILRQARRNIIRSIYTLILLQYVGLIELSTIKKYLELSEKLKDYLEALKSREIEATTLEALKEELKSLLSELAEPRRLKGSM